MKIGIVGGGVMGSVTAAYLAQHSIASDVYDDCRPEAGSRASAGLVKDSWSPLDRDATRRAMGVLDELYGLAKVELRVFPFGGKYLTLHSVPPGRFLCPRIVAAKVGRVIEAYSPEDRPHIVTATGVDRQYDAVLVATGSWTHELLSEQYLGCRVEARSGVAFRWGFNLASPFIKPWAPFKQIIAFNIHPGMVWAGDGSAIIPKNLTADRVAISQRRVTDAIGLPSLGTATETIVGRRPWIVGRKTGLFEQVAPKVWVMTGGAKGGTLLAAHYAQEFFHAIRR